MLWDSHWQLEAGSEKCAPPTSVQLAPVLISTSTVARSAKSSQNAADHSKLSVPAPLAAGAPAKLNDCQAPLGSQLPQVESSVVASKLLPLPGHGGFSAPGVPASRPAA